MAFRKQHFVTLTQQLLVLACVLAMAVAAAGVLNLDIVGPSPDARSVRPAIRMGDAYVAEKPVAPKIREVAVTGAPAIPAAPSPSPSPSQAPAAPVAPKAPATPGPGVAPGTGLRQVALSPPEKVSGLATVGVTWDQSDRFAEDQIRVDVRTQQHGAWSGWEKLQYHTEEVPNTGSAESRKIRAGTYPSLVGHVEAVQIRTLTTTGLVPRGMRLALIDPGADVVTKAKPAIDTNKLASTLKQEKAQVAKSGGTLSLSAMKIAPKPQIYSRAQWGADERIRDQSPPSYGTVQTGFVHHTVNANDYTEAQVPALLRGIYAYHVQAKGWRDIGYNYLVDRFGRIWEGRYGGVDRAVVGAHTLGYNEVSFAMSAIGNYDIAQPPPAVMNAYAQLFAWKLSLYNISATQTGINVKGKILNAINGHRDAGQTACPGRYLYAQIPNIRAMAAQIQSTGTTPPGTPTPPGPPSGPVITPVPAGSLPARSSVLGGSWPDLLVRVRGSNEVKVVPTGGQLGFTAATLSKGSWSSMDTILAPGDLTGDGRGDLVSRSKRTKVATLRRGDGAGHFGKARRLGAAFRSYTWIASAGDVNKDGRADLVAGRGKKVVLLRGTGRAGFRTPLVLAKNWSKGRLVGVGDLNRDGRPDLVRVTSRHRVVLVTPRANRLFTTRVLPVTVPSIAYVAGGGDVTGDGLPDLVVRTASGTTRVLQGNASGSLGPVLGPFPALRGIGRPTVGNAAGGGSAELVGYDGRGRLAVISSNGRSGVSTPVVSGTTVPDAAQLLNLGDWNRDGRTDLGFHQPGNDAVFLRRGDGRGGWGGVTQMGTGFAGTTNLSAVGDVTGDGNPDLMGRTAAGVMTVYPGNGKAGFGTPIAAPTALRSYNQIGSALWNPTSPGSLLTSSDGSFVPFAGSNAAAALGSGYDWVVGPGDVDGDGVADLIVREASTGWLYLLPGTGSGLGPRRFIAAGFGGYDLVG